MAAPLWEHLGGIAARLAEASQLLVLLDYDGTLTPIVDRPDGAALAPRAREAVAAVSRRRGTTVAILSGRALHDVQSCVGIDGIIYAGNHGFEIEGPGISFLCPEAAAMRPQMRVLADDLAHRFASIPGVQVEDKRLTLSIHCRLVPENQLPEFRGALARGLGDLSSMFRVTTGNKVYEIRPRTDWNKGAASTWIRQHLSTRDALPICLGDDRTDEDAFTAMSDGITIKVGNVEETVAGYSLSDPLEVCRFLNWLVASDGV